MDRPPSEMTFMQAARDSDILIARHRAAGFTLLELVLVIAVLAILAMIAVRSLGGVEDQARFDSTQRELADTQSAVNGDRGVRQPDGMAVPNGFVNDVGRLPQLVGTDPATQLQELWTQPAGVPAYAIVSLPPPDNDLQIGAGWHGPYLQLPFGQTHLVDGWGNPFSITSTTGLPPMLAAIQSLGSDNAPGSTNSDPYAADVPTLPLAFVSTDYSAPVTCIVVGASTSTPQSAKLFQPVNGVVNFVTGTLSSNSTGAMTCSFSGVSPGSRIVRLYSDAAWSVPLATRYIIVPRGGLVGYVINLAATTQPSTQPSN
jgi:prepilin-type N-terminal cleavage/methylation domain-containing protein